MGRRSPFCESGYNPDDWIKAIRGRQYVNNDPKPPWSVSMGRDLVLSLSRLIPVKPKRAGLSATGQGRLAHQFHARLRISEEHLIGAAEKVG